MADMLNTMERLREPFPLAGVESVTFAAVAELLRACELHRTFPAKLYNADLEALRRHLAIVRHINDGKSLIHERSAYLVFEEEAAEMLEAVLLGDLEAAKKELIQSMAMLLRIYVHLPEYCAQAREVMP